jgi:hypothetical protein
LEIIVDKQVFAVDLSCSSLQYENKPKADNNDDSPKKWVILTGSSVKSIAFFAFVFQQGLFVFPCQHGNIKIKSN